MLLHDYMYDLDNLRLLTPICALSQATKYVYAEVVYCAMWGLAKPLLYHDPFSGENDNFPLWAKEQINMHSFRDLENISIQKSNRQGGE